MEAFCGCLTGRVGFTDDGGQRMQAFIRQISTVICILFSSSFGISVAHSMQDIPKVEIQPDGTGSPETS